MEGKSLQHWAVRGIGERQTAPFGSQLSSLPFSTGDGVAGKQRHICVVNLVGLLCFMHLLAMATSDDEAKLVAVASFQPLERWESQEQKNPACLFKFQAVETRWKMRGKGRGQRSLSSCLQARGRAGWNSCRSMGEPEEQILAPALREGEA